MTTAENTKSSVAETTSDPAQAVQRRPRLWPAILLVALYWMIWAAATWVYAGTFQQFLMLFYTPMLVALGLIVWWLAFSRMPWRDRFWGLGSLFFVAALAVFVGDKSMKMGMLLYGFPVAATAVVAWIVITRGASTLTARVGLLVVSLLSWGYFTMLRVDGIDGNLAATKSWRWSPTAEDAFLAERLKFVNLASIDDDKSPYKTVPASETVLSATDEDWPTFRGPRRDGVVRGVKIAADWTGHPPQISWRRRVGPGWGSFVVIGNRVYTQEQRGEAEAVVCLDIETSHELWSHVDQTRFWEVVAGAGPRATPTFHDGNIYSLGANGKLNCLDAVSGAPRWSADILADAGLENPPQWGFSSSPLIAQGIVTVFAGGKDGKGVLGYDAATGKLVWSGGKGVHGYSSPQLETLGDDPMAADASQLLMVSDQGVESFEPATGKLLWEHDWNLEGIFRVCQPLVVDHSRVLVGTGFGHGTRLLKIDRNGETWQADEVWTSRDLKPYFNDFVLHDGHLYGFDGSIMAAIDLATGKKAWKKGRYGHGQVLLVEEQGLLIVLSETGELVLLEATPEEHRELARFQALSGKTWNHPVLSRGRLLVRNSEEMACYDVSESSADRTGGE